MIRIGGLELDDQNRRIRSKFQGFKDTFNLGFVGKNRIIGR